MSENGIVKIRGKDYVTVAKRVSDFRGEHADWTIQTEIVRCDADGVIMKASIMNPAGKLIATGFAEENRTGGINSTSALENCETSAIGRALACFGMAGTEFASADEMSEAAIQQQADKITERLIRHNTAVRDNLESVLMIKCELAAENYSAAAEAWFELDNDTKQDLWVAPTKGGIFTTQEREIMKTNDFKNSYYGTPEDED
ncbi:MAG: hypothetical protein R3183_14495 [Oleiphilaceae bacterium]|nr:hypothetical protein [Oleiphilaceae bacterium]